MKLKKLNLGRYTTLQLSGFCDKVDQHIHDDLSETEQNLFQYFCNAQRSYQNAQNQTKEAFGLRLQQADIRADKAWRAIHTLIELNIEHYDESIVKAAQKVATVFNSVQNPTSLKYNEEYAELKRLIELMDEVDGDVLKTAMVDGWLSELKVRVDEFDTLRREQTNASQEIELGAVKKARNELIEAYKVLIDTVNVMLVIQSTDTMVKFAKNMETIHSAEKTAQKIADAKENNDKGDKSNALIDGADELA